MWLYKVSYDFGRIVNGLKLTFGIIVREDATGPLKARYKQKDSIFSKYKFGGSEYLKFAPHPFVTIDINKSGDNKDSWNAGCLFTMNRVSIFHFKYICNTFIKKYENKDLFYIKNNELFLNNELVKSSTMYMYADKGKLALIPSLYIENDANGTKSEGVSLCINSIDNICNMKYMEFRYLLDTISNIDMNAMAMELTNAYMMYEMCGMKGVELTVEKQLPPKTVKEVQNEGSVSEPPPKIVESNTIPDI